MSMSALGQSFSTTFTDTTDSYVAPALKAEMGDESARFEGEGAGDILNILTGGTGGGMGQMMSKAMSAQKRIAQAGYPVKSVSSVTTTVGGTTNRRRQTTELLKFERAAVADSVFAIPAGYRKVEPMIRINPSPDSALRTSRSLRTPF